MRLILCLIMCLGVVSPAFCYWDKPTNINFEIKEMREAYRVENVAMGSILLLTGMALISNTPNLVHVMAFSAGCGAVYFSYKFYFKATRELE